MRKTSIFRSALLLTGSDLLLRLMGIGFNAFLAHRMGAEGLGLLQLISSVGFFALIVGSSGVRVAAMCLTAEEFGKGDPVGAYAAVRACLKYGLCVSLSVGGLLFFLAPVVAKVLLGSGAAVVPLRIMAVFLPCSCLCGVMTGYFTACGEVRRTVAVQIAERLFSMVFTAVVLLHGAADSTDAACCTVLLGSSLGSALEFFLLYLLFRRRTRPLRREKRPKMGQRLKKLCIPLALNDYLRAGLNTAEQLLIPFGLARFGASAGSALAAHGTIHGMVFPVLMFPAAILFSLSDLLVPELARSRAEGCSSRIRGLADRCLRLTWLYGCAVGGFLFCCARPLGLLIYGSREAGRYLQIFAPMALMLYLDAIADGMLKGLSQQLSCVRYNTLTSLMDVGLLFFLLPRWGIGGYIFSFALTHGINLLLSLRRLLKISRYRLRLGELGKGLVCLLLALSAAQLLPGQAAPREALLGRGGFFLCLLLGLYLLWDAVSAQDLRWFRGVLFPKKDPPEQERKLPFRRR
ncbi:MAG: polysaccharide biosynthesis C-terminal domain-containing protein [Oscillospiraceae bacterium]|nr:polysaccharide biosynthesis C-terminal domain-containing protein [Oscillospiraceae bacterium]